MLSGDNDATARRVSAELGLDKYYADLLPEDKVQRLEELLSQSSSKDKLAYVGDGINDAPVLARADVGIAMGGLGSDAAIEAADVVIMTDEPSKIVTAIRIAKKTLGIAWQNIYLAIAVKIAVLILSAWGITTLWAAIFADVGVTIIAVLNSLRALQVSKL
jgi:Cd2+/Zn2+-exporting ATPase